ncbi:hypothetical protein H8S20_01750 [Clostridium sp. NSJ-6]|uniref:Peptidase S74 domain-containing protein n=1 Tax=Clostridium hominis TaxID=2763036 RepID=A0ABR7D8T2_9CLOT|nr:phage tail spike protein [Clostridium hominis]MBC5627612.1 hypothetical protein [Clostridium hominis]
MIKIFKKDETNFSHDGLEVLDDIVISSYTEWSEESKWIIQAKFKKDFDKSESIKEGLIIQVPTEKGDQLFRILKINKKNRKYISISGHAIGYDFNDNFIQDINIVEKSGRVAMQQISNGTVYPHRYNLTSNIDRVASARVVRKNGMEALINTDKDNTFVERWGGCLVLDNFNISMNEAVGQDRGVEISIGKNITGYDGDIDEETVCTGINAITYDGLTLPEGVYYSPLVNNYPHPKIREFKFDDIKYKYSENNYDKEGYETLDEVYAAIRKACDDLFNTQNIDKPTCSLRVNIAALENTDQYKGDELNERIFQGDILTANLEDYGFNVKLKMVANRYDNIRNRYIDIDLGDAKNNLFKDIGKIEVVIDKVVEQLGGNTWQDILDKSMQEAADLIAAGIKDSYVVARKNEILIMDSPQVESAINVIRMNKNGIAFSQNGYNGPYTLAITIDGKINASCITTGQLNAALIKTGMLMSANGTTWIDMENGTFNFANKINFDGANFDIDLSGKDLATNTSVDTKFEINNKGINETIKNTKEGLETEIKKNAEAITQKVSNSDFNSYKNQTANEISQKVSNGDFGTLFKQTAYGFDFIGKITTKSDNYKLELNASKLIGFKGNDIAKPMYSAGVWWPNGQPAGYVSVSKGNAETVGTDGALWMTAYPNDNDKAAGIQYMKKHNDGTYVGSIIEFSEAGSISLVSQKTTGAARYGLWSHPDGYVYPYQGDEQLGSNIKPWNKMYCNSLYYKNYSTPFSNSTLAESYEVTTLNEEVSRTLVTSEVEKYKDDNSFYTFYKDKFESLVYTDGGNKDRLVVNPNSMLNDPIASILVSKDGDELLLDNNSYITSLTMALKRSIEKIEKLEDRIKVLEGGV